MLPEVVIHNSISLDGSLTNFESNMELHYQIAGNYEPDAHLIGSNTVKAGIELYGEGVPPEKDVDFEKPKRDEKLPYWVIPDTKGTLKGLLHTCRRFEYCRDIIMLVSETTPNEYLKHLKERNYNFHMVGKKNIDLKKALNLLSTQYGIKKVLVDSGRILSNLLLTQRLASEISLLIHPVIVGKKAYTIFGDINDGITLKLLNSKNLEAGCVWLVYKVSFSK